MPQKQYRGKEVLGQIKRKNSILTIRIVEVIMAM